MFMSDAMKFGKFARLLGALLSTGTGLSMPTPRRRSASVPTGAALRNPADPFQAERIERAAAKRQRKGVKLMADSGRMGLFNQAHRNSLHTGLAEYTAWAGGRLNPFHINR
jgi:hypothetical protein